MQTIGYYPGCALHGSSNDYEQSVQVCLKALDVKLSELDDWICCGASAAHAINHKLSIALPARNLAIAERDGYDSMLAPCPMCSSLLLKASAEMQKDRRLQEEMSTTVELPVSGKTNVLNLIQILQQVGIEKIQQRVKRTLGEFKPACYYGCLLVRPPEVLRFDDCEHPTSMETILSALGAAPVEWNYKTECCGAGMTMCNEQTVLELSHKIISDAKAHGANCLVVACQMCQVNLDMKQANIERLYNVQHDMVVYYLSDLVGLALGLQESDLGINRHFVTAKK